MPPLAAAAMHAPQLPGQRTLTVRADILAPYTHTSVHLSCGTSHRTAGRHSPAHQPPLACPLAPLHPPPPPPLTPLTLLTPLTPSRWAEHVNMLASVAQLHKDWAEAALLFRLANPRLKQVRVYTWHAHTQA